MENWDIVSFDTKDIMQRDLLSTVLAEEGFDSFEETNQQLIGYCIADSFNTKKINEILAEINLAAIHFDIKKLETKNWNETWEKNFTPVIIADSIGIRAPFHEPLHSKIELVIEPKMSFGTGHHQTTALMSETMLSLDFKAKKVLDFGSGTGILSILAEKLGATHIVAIDNEDWAFENAKENAERNDCSHISCILGDENTSINDTFDIILANINRNVILSNIVKWYPLLVENGVILLSGILVTDEKDISTKMKECNFTHQQTLEKDGWLCMQFIKNKNN